MPQTNCVITCKIGHSGQSLVFADQVVQHLLRHRQKMCLQREAGGQLFAQLAGTEIMISAASGPRMSDRRTRYRYIPDRKAEQAEIIEHFARGLHYVGDWHTHPEAHPRPSSVDLKNIAECVARSRHQLAGLVHVIVGQADPPDGWCVLVHDGTAAHVLNPLKD